MKRMWLLLMGFLLLFPVAAADSVVEGGYQAPAVPTPEPPPLRDDPMIQNVVEIAGRIDILAESELFMSYYSYGMVDEKQVEAVSYGDHTRPVRAFHLDGQTLIAGLYAGADAADMLDFTRPELLRDLVNELPEILWGRREDTELSVLALLARYKVFALEGAQGCGLYILLYEEGAPVLVTWTAQNDCVSAAAFFMPDETLAAVDDAQDVSDWFASAGMPVVTFEEVPLT